MREVPGSFMCSPDVTAILMAKRPDPGRVKTRLIDPAQGMDACGAAHVARAMTHCVGQRLAEVFGRENLIVAVSPDDAGDLGISAAHTMPQGSGDLGDRLDRVWMNVIERQRADNPVAFFGIDSPDVPRAHLQHVQSRWSAQPTDTSASQIPDVLLGPTSDGGYWTLASRRYHPEVLQQIDWGSPQVAQQTLERAGAADLHVETLPPWYDVDDLTDLSALMDRIQGVDNDPALNSLNQALRAVR